MLHLSSMALSDVEFEDFALILRDLEVEAIEMSAGKWHANIIEKLHNLKKHSKISFHNYFPVPRNPFVLNLASADPIIFKQSMDMILAGIDLSHQFGASHYSFHAGFLIDPSPKELGGLFTGKVISREEGTTRFLEALDKISKHAAKKEVKILIENNVITKQLLNKFPDNPLLFTSPWDLQELILELPENSGLLIDMGHLKISAKTLSFDPDHFMIVASEKIGGFHLSDNDGLSDQNLSYTDGVWFERYLRCAPSYVCLEVKPFSRKSLERCIKFTKEICGH